MTFQNQLGLAVVSLLWASGCAHSTRVASVHVEEPGTHIVTGQGAISIAKNTSTGSRVCTRVLSTPQKNGRHGKAAPPARDPGARLDILLFRLCEARSNGDISAEQYASSVQSVVKSLEQMANRPRMSMTAPDAGERRPRVRRARRWELRGRGPERDGDDDRDPPKPEPRRETPK